MEQRKRDYSYSASRKMEAQLITHLEEGFSQCPSFSSSGPARAREPGRCVRSQVALPALMQPSSLRLPVAQLPCRASVASEEHHVSDDMVQRTSDCVYLCASCVSFVQA